MGGLEIKEVWRPPTSCNLFITSFTFRPCLPLVRGCMWLNTGSNRNHRRKQGNGSHKKQSNQSFFLCQSLPSHFLAGHIRKVFMTLTHIGMGHSRWRQQETDLGSPRDVCLWIGSGGEHSWLSNSTDWCIRFLPPAHLNTFLSQDGTTWK